MNPIRRCTPPGWNLALALTSFAALLITAGPCAAEATATDDGADIQEWTVPYPNSRPRDPSVGDDGRIWFVGQTDNYLGVFDPESQQFERIGLPQGARPHSVTVAPNGDPWVAGNGDGTLLRYSPAGQLEQTIEVPTSSGLKVRDPHTLAFDGHGGLWFSMQNGNAIGHLLLASAELTVIPMQTEKSRPYGLVSDAQGNAWAVLFAGGKLVRIDRQSKAVQEYPLPRELARPRRLALDDQQRVWYVDYAQDVLGRFDPGSGEFKEWALPKRPAAPYAMAIDARQRVWLFLTAPQPNTVLSFDPRNETFSAAQPIESGAGAVRHAEYHRASDSIWFGTDRNTLGQLRLSAISADD